MRNPQTIQDWVQKHYPKQFNSTKWGCHIIKSLRKEVQLRKEFPKGWKVELPTCEYWFWLEE